MSKKLICVLLILGLSTAVYGGIGDKLWNGMYSDQWDDGMGGFNWTPMGVPTIGDPCVTQVDLPGGTPYDAVIYPGTAAAVPKINISNSTGAHAQLTMMPGSSLVSDGYITIAREAGDSGTFIMDGADVVSSASACGRNGISASWSMLNGSTYYSSRIAVPARDADGTLIVSASVCDITEPLNYGNGNLAVPSRWGGAPTDDKYPGHGEVYIQQDGVIMTNILTWDPAMGSASFIEISGNGKLVLTGIQGAVAKAVLADGLFVGIGDRVGWDPIDGNTVFTVGGTYVPEPMTSTPVMVRSTFSRMV